jgi:hypothetical protein
MASFQGQLLKGGQVLYQVSGRLQFQSREEIRVWGGHFTLPLEAQSHHDHNGRNSVKMSRVKGVLQ